MADSNIIKQSNRTNERIPDAVPSRGRGIALNARFHRGKLTTSVETANAAQRASPSKKESARQPMDTSDRNSSCELSPPLASTVVDAAGAAYEGLPRRCLRSPPGGKDPSSAVGRGRLGKGRMRMVSNVSNVSDSSAGLTMGEKTGHKIGSKENKTGGHVFFSHFWARSSFFSSEPLTRLFRPQEGVLAKTRRTSRQALQTALSSGPPRTHWRRKEGCNGPTGEEFRCGGSP